MTYEDEIKPYRGKINQLNDQILDLIKARIIVALNIGKIKRKYGKPIVDKQREEAVIEQVRRLAVAREVAPDAVERIFRELIKACVEAEESND